MLEERCVGRQWKRHYDQLVLDEMRHELLDIEQLVIRVLLFPL